MKTKDVKFKKITFIFGDNKCNDCVANIEGLTKNECAKVMKNLTGVHCLSFKGGGYFRFKELWEPCTKQNTMPGDEIRLRTQRDEYARTVLCVGSINIFYSVNRKGMFCNEYLDLIKAFEVKK